MSEGMKRTSIYAWICKSDDTKTNSRPNPNVNKGTGIILDSFQTLDNFISISSLFYSIFISPNILTSIWTHHHSPFHTTEAPITQTL